MRCGEDYTWAHTALIPIDSAKYFCEWQTFGFRPGKEFDISLVKLVVLLRLLFCAVKCCALISEFSSCAVFMGGFTHNAANYCTLTVGKQDLPYTLVRTEFGLIWWILIINELKVRFFEKSLL